jgi:multiple sugar transport system permease protein
MATHSTAAVSLPRAPAAAARGLSNEAFWGVVFIAPYLLVFALFVIYPILYGLWLGSSAVSYRKLFQDPVFETTISNTVIFLLVAVNVKMVFALALSGFFLREERWIRWLSFLFVLAWAMPSIPTILSFRWMFNPEWGVVNETIWRWFQVEGPNWLTERHYGLGLAIIVHIWKSLPFWTLILLAARMAIPKDLYEAAAVDGATMMQTFRHVTWASISGIYLTSVLLSTIWSLGDFNSIYLMTGGGPYDLTQVLATLGVRFYEKDAIDKALAAIIVAMPAVLPMVWFMMKRLSATGEAR